MKVVGSKFYIEHEGVDFIVDQTKDQTIVFQVSDSGAWLALDVIYGHKTTMTPNMAVAAVMKALNSEAVNTNRFCVDDGIPD